MKNSSNPQGEMHLFDHLRELRKRLLVSIMAVSAGAILAYALSEQIFGLLAAPYVKAFPGEPLIGTGPAEAFMIKIKLAIFSGAIIAAPIVFHQLWLFISPGLLEQERKLVTPFLATTTSLFFFGIWFCYVAVFPITYDFFFEQYRSIGVSPAIRIGEHMSFMTRILLAFGAVFELPVLAYCLGRLGLIDDKMMIEGSRYAAVIIFVLAAVLTPPDVLSQILMAIPLLVLYGVSILVVRHTGKKREEK